MENLRTLCFKNKKEAERNKKNIEEYFKGELLSCSIKFGDDERGGNGYYIEYQKK